MSRRMNGIAVVGVCAMLAGIGMSAAHADGTYDKLNDNVRRDMEHIRRDQTRIQDLKTKRHLQKTKGDYRHAGYTSNDLAKAQINLDRDRAMLARDQREFARYRAKHKM